MQDAYTVLAEKHRHGESELYKNYLKVLMNDDEAKLVAALPAGEEVLSQELDKSVDEIKSMIQSKRKRIISIKEKSKL